MQQQRGATPSYISDDSTTPGSRAEEEEEEDDDATRRNRSGLPSGQQLQHEPQRQQRRQPRYDDIAVGSSTIAATGVLFPDQIGGLIPRGMAESWPPPSLWDLLRRADERGIHFPPERHSLPRQDAFISNVPLYFMEEEDVNDERMNRAQQQGHPLHQLHPQQQLGDGQQVHIQLILDSALASIHDHEENIDANLSFPPRGGPRW